jgi:hypothetical protein
MNESNRLILGEAAGWRFAGAIVASTATVLLLLYWLAEFPPLSSFANALSVWGLLTIASLVALAHTIYLIAVRPEDLASRDRWGISFAGGLGYQFLVFVACCTIGYAVGKQAAWWAPPWWSGFGERDYQSSLSLVGGVLGVPIYYGFKALADFVIRARSAFRALAMIDDAMNVPYDRRYELAGHDASIPDLPVRTAKGIQRDHYRPLQKVVAELWLHAPRPAKDAKIID